MRRLLPELLRCEVSSQFHCVVEDPADKQDVTVAPADQEVARTVDVSTG